MKHNWKVYFWDRKYNCYGFLKYYDKTYNYIEKDSRRFFNEKFTDELGIESPKYEILSAVDGNFEGSFGCIYGY